MPKVQIVDDEEPLRASLSYALTREGYSVSTAADGPSALARAQADAPDVIVLDLMLPGLPGMEVRRRIRESSDVPIVMLTAKDQRKDKVDGLSLGADDYMTKPFDTHELVARLAAVLRRRASAQKLLDEDRALLARMEDLVRQASPPRTEGTIERRHDTVGVLDGGRIVIDPDSLTVTVDGRAVALSASEYAVLRIMLSYAGRVATRTDLIEKVWGASANDGYTLLAVHVRTLREKLEEDPANPRVLVSVPGIGFRLDMTPSA